MSPVTIDWLQGSGVVKREREGKNDIQDTALGDIGIRTAGPVLGDARGKSGPRRKMPSFILNRFLEDL